MCVSAPPSVVFFPRAGIPLPTTQAGDKLFPVEGLSLVPALRGDGTQVHEAAFSQYPRKPADDEVPWQKNGIDHSTPAEFKYMGYSVRVEGWRYTEWYHWNQTSLAPQWGAEGLYSAELYDHRAADAAAQAGPAETRSDYDANTAEVQNAVGDAQLRAEVVPRLARLLRQQFLAHSRPGAGATAAQLV